MKLLLDTHCWLWMRTAPEKLSGSARDLLIDPENDLYLSPASSWEIAIKYELGRLSLPEPPAQYVPKRLAQDSIQSLNIDHRHTLETASLPTHHRDPFDRLLIAQSRIEGLPLMSADEVFSSYDVELLKA
ncbi:MAG TPA: type II toxin-antitoxin system VapC family toxin [Acidobacteriota bacterium]|nr:type II toxin-antitoxin system VapC family toxin [Acidobacteriota bacterium]